jgi:hypothetical protein
MEWAQVNYMLMSLRLYSRAISRGCGGRGREIHDHVVCIPAAVLFDDPMFARLFLFGSTL